MKKITSLLAGAILMMAVNASAYTFYLTEGNTAISGGNNTPTTAYASVDLSVTGNVASFTVTGLSNAFYNYLFSDIFLNVNGLSYVTTTTNKLNPQGKVIGTTTTTTAVGVPTYVGPAGSTAANGIQNVSSLGNFNYAVSPAANNGYAGAKSSFTFSLTNTSTAAWTADALTQSVLTADATSGNFAAAHIIFQNKDLTNANLTGFAADGTPNTPNTPVPEPGTMMLLGMGMLGLAVYGKRRMNKEA